MRPAVVELPGSVEGGRRGRRPLTRTPGASFERGLKRPGEPHSDARRRLFRNPHQGGSFSSQRIISSQYKHTSASAGCR